MKIVVFFHTAGLVEDSKKASPCWGSLLYVILKLFLKPFGTSYVIFTPIYNTADGNLGDG